MGSRSHWARCSASACSAPRAMRTAANGRPGPGGFPGPALLWVIGGVLVLGGAVLYADVSSRVPEAGGPYAFVRVAFGGRGGFAAGLALGGVWYTYLGWQDTVLLAEELHEPRRDIPFVLCATVLLTMVLFTALH